MVGTERDQLQPAIVSIPIALAGAVGASLGLIVTAPYSALGAFEELLIGGSAGVVFAAGALMAGRHPLRGEVAMLLMRFRHAD